MLVDIGGQDTKVIRIGAGGEVLDFAMNDKCAAGTGRFLEVILARLGVALDQAPELVARAAGEVAISSHLHRVRGERGDLPGRPGRAAGGDREGAAPRPRRPRRHARRRLVDGAELFMSGGVALNAAMVDALADAVGRPVTVLPEPQLVGALGAALSVSG